MSTEAGQQGPEAYELADDRWIAAPKRASKRAPERAREPSRERSARGFARTAGAVIGALALACGWLAWASAARPPRTTAVIADLGELVAAPSGVVELRFDQPIAPLDPAAVTVEPPAPFSLEQAGAAIRLRFDEPLDYATGYTVTLEASGRSTGAHGPVSATFATADATVDTLIRDLGAQPGAPVDTSLPDRVVRQQLAAAGSQQVLLEAPVILEHAATADIAAAIVADEAGATRVVVRSILHGADVPLFDLRGASVRSLQASRSGGYLGFVADGGGGGIAPGYESALLLVPADDPGAVPRVVAGFDGGALRVRQWAPVPRGSGLVVLTEDGELPGLDPLGRGQPTRLGDGLRVDSLDGAAPGGAGLLATVGGVRMLVDPDLKVVTPLADTPLAAMPVPAVAAAAGADGRDALVLDGRALLQAGQSERMGRVCLSPNAEYAAVELLPASGVSDGLPLAPGIAGTTTRFVRLEDGASSRGATGMASSWCAAP